LAAQRNNGRANIISIRGFGPDFSTTTLNGRQQTTTNDSRAVEFDQYPSEILAGVDVYKTSEADHTAGGLVGSIDMRTIRPLDYGHEILAACGECGTENGFDSEGPEPPVCRSCGNPIPRTSAGRSKQYRACYDCLR